VLAVAGSGLTEGKGFWGQALRRINVVLMEQGLLAIREIEEISLAVLGK